MDKPEPMEFSVTESTSRISFLELKRVCLVFICLLALFSVGLLMVMFLGGTVGISRYFYFLVDVPGFVVVLMTAFALGALAPLPTVCRRLTSISMTRLPLLMVAAIALGLSVLGVTFVYKGYAFSMDEWMTQLQAEIFLSGHLSATVPEEWRSFGRAMYHPFASYDPITGTLASNYRPGMSLLYAAFEIFGLGKYTSAVMNAAAVLLVMRVARQIFPAAKEAPIVAGVLLATSQQALAASLTSYAMSAHLCLNLLWLTLFLNDRFRSHLAAALVGVLTASLHQIHFHLFFALPFLLTLFRPLRLGLLALYGGIYLVGHLAVMSWDWWSFNSAVVAGNARLVAAGTAPTADINSVEARGVFLRVLDMAKLPSLADVASVIANLVRMIAWQSLALVPLLIAGLSNVRSNRMLVLVVWSLGVSTLPYPILMPDQGHGWGYRYLHGLLGHLVLLAIPGWIALREKSEKSPFLSWVIACLFISPVILVPFRGYQISALVEPYAQASAFVSAQDAEVTIVDSYGVVFVNDIPRNSPLNPEFPIAMNLHQLSASQIKELCANYAVAIPTLEDYERIGLRVFDEVRPEYADRYQSLSAELASCNR